MMMQAPDTVEAEIRSGFDLSMVEDSYAIEVSPGSIVFKEAGDEIEETTGKRFDVIYELKNRLVFRPVVQNIGGRTDAIGFRIDYVEKTIRMVYIHDFSNRRERIRSDRQYYYILTEIEW